MMQSTPPTPPTVLDIIFIEDSPEDVQFTIDFLDRAGVQVRARRVDTEEAFRREAQTPPDIILADYTLPCLTVDQALAARHELCPMVPFVIITGSISEEAAVACIKKGATDYLLKDRLARLPAAIRSAMLEFRVIRERAEVEEALRLELELRQRIITSAVCAIATLDPRRRHVKVNPRYCDLTGYAESELLGMPFDNLVAEEDRSGFEQTPPRASDSIKERELVRKDGTRVPVLGGLSAFSIDGHPAGIVSSFLDLTDRKRLEARLRETSKLEAIGRLAGGIAHDFNNMLTAILGHASLLRSRIPVGEPLREHATHVIAAARSAAGLTGQLLTFARQGSSVRTGADVNDLVQHVAPMLERLIRENIEIVIDLADQLPGVMVDPVQIEQLILNLAINARDAIEATGMITIRTRCERRCLAATGEITECVVISVRDTGCGMPSEILQRIFEPFFSTKALGHGTGLGLSICYGIVHQHGGQIDVESQPGRGTTFEIMLPTTRTPAQGESAREPEEPGSPAHGTVLLAEDNPLVREVVTLSLRDQGYTVVVASDGAEAVEHAKHHGGAIDLLVADVMMPKLGGYELAATLREFIPGLKVVCISGYSDDRRVALDGITLLSKPFAPSELISCIRSVMETGPHTPEKPAPPLADHVVEVRMASDLLRANRQHNASPGS